MKAGTLSSLSLYLQLTNLDGIAYCSVGEGEYFSLHTSWFLTETYLCSLISRHPRAQRRFHDSHLTPGMLSNHQTSEFLHGRQLPGSGPLPLHESFLLLGSAPPASRRYSIYHSILQSFMWTGTVPRSSLCQRENSQKSFVG